MLDNNFGSTLLMDESLTDDTSDLLGLGDEDSCAGSLGVVLAHDVAVVSDDSARSIPDLVDASALDGADVEVGLAIDTADGLVLGVARAVLVDDNLARLFSGD
jgi:hypothetical protein